MEDGALGKVLAGLASIATVVGTVVAVMAYRDTKQQPVPEEPTASYAEQTAAQTETQTEAQTAEMTLSAGTESAAEVQTAAVTDTTAAAAVTEQAAVTGTAAARCLAHPKAPIRCWWTAAASKTAHLHIFRRIFRALSASTTAALCSTMQMTAH